MGLGIDGEEHEGRQQHEVNGTLQAGGSAGHHSERAPQ
jgi:hypothetical protein